MQLELLAEWRCGPREPVACAVVLAASSGRAGLLAAVAARKLAKAVARARVRSPVTPFQHTRMNVHTVFDYDPSEHYLGVRTVTRLTPLRYMQWVMVAVALGMLAWTVVPAWGEFPPMTIFWSALPWLVLTIFWITFFPFMQRRASRTLASRDASVIGPQERSIDAVGFHSRGNGVSLDVPWHAMARVVETDRLFLFFYNKRCAYYLPKRVLTPEQVTVVRELARTALRERAKLLSA